MRRSANLRAGFTLLEMMLVLGVVAVFLGMTLPSVMKIFGQQKLTESAEKVRTAIASARARAIDSGIIYQFCCEPKGSNYVVVPFEADHVNSRDASQSGAINLVSRGSGRLPAGVFFNTAALGMSGVVATGLGPHKLAPAALDGLPNASDLGNVAWAPPILFKPDGSATMDAEIIVSDSRSQSVKLHVRAFTGSVSMERLTTGTR
jgi:prepilin-type N-terminal cleavage/methylation domain-containing protein